MMPDTPLLSPRRLRDAVRLYFYFLWPDRGRTQVYVPLWRLLAFHRRPEACHRYDTRRRGDAYGRDEEPTSAVGILSPPERRQ